MPDTECHSYTILPKGIEITGIAIWKHKAESWRHDLIHEIIFMFSRKYSHQTITLSTFKSLLKIHYYHDNYKKLTNQTTYSHTKYHIFTNQCWCRAPNQLLWSQWKDSNCCLWELAQLPNAAWFMLTLPPRWEKTLCRRGIPQQWGENSWQMCILSVCVSYK